MVNTISTISRMLTKLRTYVAVPETGKPLLIPGLAIVMFIIFTALATPLLTPYDPTEQVAQPFLPPSVKHIFGTNNLGMDMWSRVVYGSRTVLLVVFSAVFMAMTIGVPLGLVSGYFGGRVDRVLSIIMDSLYAFPSIVLAIALAVALGPGLFNAVIAIATVYVPTYFRMVRGQVLSLREEPFIEMAKILGIPVTKILFSHILPHLIPTIMVVFSLNAADAVLTEAALSFLGLSVQFPTPDWGYDLYKGKGFVPAGFWWLAFFPGLMITLLAVGFALIGEGLSEQVRREIL